MSRMNRAICAGFFLTVCIEAAINVGSAQSRQRTNYQSQYQKSSSYAQQQKRTTTTSSNVQTQKSGIHVQQQPRYSRPQPQQSKSNIQTQTQKVGTGVTTGTKSTSLKSPNSNFRTIAPMAQTTRPPLPTKSAPSSFQFRNDPINGRVTPPSGASASSSLISPGASSSMNPRASSNVQNSYPTASRNVFPLGPTRSVPPGTTTAQSSAATASVAPPATTNVPPVPPIGTPPSPKASSSSLTVTSSAATTPPEPTASPAATLLATGIPPSPKQKSTEQLMLEMVGTQTPQQRIDAAIEAHNHALVLAREGNLVEAEKLATEPLAVFEEIEGSESQLIVCLGTCGWLRAKQGDFATARENYARAADLSKNRNDPAQHAIVLDDLAALELEMGDYEAAEQLYSEGLAERKKAGSTAADPYYRSSVHNLGVIYERQGRLAEAEKILTENLESIKAEKGSSYELAHTLETLAFLYGDQGRLAEAESHYQQALAAHMQPDPVTMIPPLHTADYARTMNNLGFLYARRGDFAKAEPLQKEAMHLREKLLGKSNPEYADGLEDIAAMYFAMGDIETARQKLAESLDVTQFHLDIASNVQSERQQLLMAKLLRRRLDLYISMADAAMTEQVYSRILTWKGAVFQRQHCLRMARENPELQDRLEKLGHLAQQLSALVMHPPEESRRNQWRTDIAKLTNEKEQLERVLAPKRGKGEQVKIGGVANPADLASALPKDGALVDYFHFERMIIDRDAGPGKPVWHNEPQYVAFVMTPSGIDRFDLGPSAPINDAITSWRVSIARHAMGDDESSPSKFLRQHIWAPFESKLTSASMVLISPDSGLNFLPFATLPGRNPKSFLIEDVGIAIAPVPQQIPELLRPAPPRDHQIPNDADHEAASSLLVLGAVNFDSGSTPPEVSQQIASRLEHPHSRGAEDQKWQKLEATVGEIATIAKRFRKSFDHSKLTELEDDEATKVALCTLAPSHRFLHLATHGFFSSNRLTSTSNDSRDGSAGDHHTVGLHPGLLSGLVLAGANHPVDEFDDDGILTALEVAELDLRNVELATLSACETGLGVEVGGEGLLGLQRAFHVAGAHTVVASLWEVSDESTRALMERFYENLWKKRLSRYESLREAQLWMLKEGKSRGLIRNEPTHEAESRTPPLYWAAFVLSGDWR